MTSLPSSAARASLSNYNLNLEAALAASLAPSTPPTPSQNEYKINALDIPLLPDFYGNANLFFKLQKIMGNGWCFYNSVLYGLNLVNNEMSLGLRNFYSFILSKIIGNILLDIIRKKKYESLSENNGENLKSITKENIQNTYEDIKQVNLRNLTSDLSQYKLQSNILISKIKKEKKKSNNKIFNSIENYDEKILDTETEIKKINDMSIDNFIQYEIKRAFTPKTTDLSQGPQTWVPSDLFSRVLCNFVGNIIGICIFYVLDGQLKLMYKTKGNPSTYYINLFFNGRDHYDYLIPCIRDHNEQSVVVPINQQDQIHIEDFQGFFYSQFNNPVVTTEIEILPKKEKLEHLKYQEFLINLKRIREREQLSRSSVAERPSTKVRPTREPPKPPTFAAATATKNTPDSINHYTLMNNKEGKYSKQARKYFMEHFEESSSFPYLTRQERFQTLGLWHCPSCTFLNPPSVTVCEMCGTHKPMQSGGNELSRKIKTKKSKTTRKLILKKQKKTKKH